MTVFIDFFQPPNALFQFNAVLDGNQYLIQTPWNVYRGDYYVFIFDQNGNRVLTVPRIGSPPNYNINLISIRPDLFTVSSLIWRPSTGQFEVGP